MIHFTKHYFIAFLLAFCSSTLLFADDIIYFSCSDGILNGQETGVDCGGPSCPPCFCTDDRLLLDNYVTNNTFTRSAYQWIFLDEDVMHQSNSNIIYKAADYIEIDHNFEIELGSETLLTIEECIEPTSCPPFDPNSLSRDNCGTEFQEMIIGSDICNPDRPDITLRLNLNIIRDDNGENGIYGSQLTNMINQLNITYDSLHRIYFDICLSEINRTDILIEGPTSENLNILYSSYSEGDAINGYLFPFGVGDFAGVAQGIPSKNFWSNPQSFTLGHELGHCLGLYHTHMGYYDLLSDRDTCFKDICLQERVSRPQDCGGTCPPFDCDSPICGPNCHETGDYVCDTPPDLEECEKYTIDVNGILNYTDWTDDCGESYMSNNIVPSNVMSYWSGGKFITEGQACRIYTTALAFHQDAIVDPDPPMVINNDLVINGDVVISTNHIFNANIIVEPGASLTFNGIRAEFSESSQIIINTIVLGQGYTYTKSTLNIHDSKLVPSCGTLSWAGFDLDEGVDVNISNSEIVNAELFNVSFNSFITDENIPSQYLINGSVFLDSPISINHVDGFVEILGSTFIRNKFSGNALVKILGDVMPFDAFLSDCTFINNQDLLVPSADALVIQDIGFVCLNSTFNNFDRAIHAFPFQKAPDGALVKDCTFRDNVYAIEASTYSGFKIQDNIFDVGQAFDNYTDTHTGVYLNYCIDYIITGNTFKKGSSGTDRKGLIIKNGGPDFEQVVSNSFDGLNEAIIALGNNRNVSNDGLEGLEFNCNNMGLGSIVDTDILIEDDGIQRQQGDPTDGAGNNFSYGNFSDPESSIRMLTSTDMSYYRANNQLTNNPDYVDPLKVTVTPADNTPSCFDDLNFRIIHAQNDTKETLSNLIDLHQRYKAEIVNNEFSRNEIANILRDINLDIKNIINKSDFEFSESDKQTYWTEYKTSKVAKRKAILENLKVEKSKLDSVINDIAELSAERYSTNFKEHKFVEKINKRISSSSQDFEAELYRNLLLSVNYK